jgi:hypothetical protein
MTCQDVTFNVKKLDKKKVTIRFLNSPVGKQREYLMNLILLLLNRFSPVSIKIILE